MLVRMGSPSSCDRLWLTICSRYLPHARLCWFVALIAVASSARADLPSTLKPLLDGHGGDVSVCIKNLKTGETFEHRAQETMPTASLIKFPVLIELYRQMEEGTISRDRMIKLTKEEMVQGSGILTQHFQPGTMLPMESVARLMITYSDNTATNMVLEQTGLKPVNETMQKMGYPETRVHSKAFRRDLSVDMERSVKYGLGSTTAADMVSLLEKVQNRQVVSKEACDTILKHLLTCDDRSKIPRYLPKSIKIYHKTGSVANVRTDAGLIDLPSGMIAIAVLTNNNKDQSWGDENAAEILIGKIALATVEHYSPESLKPASKETGNRTLRVGATGEWVEGVQRALNRLMVGATSISVDGDFGPATESMVKKFQASKGLPETGIVDDATWKALGPISLEKEEVLDPVQVNEAPLPKSPRDPLTGTPFVSSPAWVIVNGETGKILAGDKSNQKRDIASTTKIMTAWLVLQEAKRDPQVLEEIVTFSKRADETVGSSATIREGEKVSVRELLYGLMLPSGNDASVAFGEHLGARIAKRQGKATVEDPLQEFVEEMNREAIRLGMTQSFFVNTSGLTAEKHKSSCEDLVLLAREAMKDELFRKVVSTRQHGATVSSVAGYSRNLIWTNTNPLLKTEGYVGIKTGTTDAAGACLVSCSERDGKSLFVVILGASGSPAREADSRNLHRYGWQLMQAP